MDRHRRRCRRKPHPVPRRRTRQRRAVARLRLDARAARVRRHAHGHQGDTVDIGLAVVTEATSHRSLYVGATRGRDQNKLLVVTEAPDQAREVLERVLTNDRVDLPAVAQRRNLARQVPKTGRAEDAVAAARHALDHARAAAEPALQPLDAAEAELRAAELAHRNRQLDLEHAPRWRRRAMASHVRYAFERVANAQTKLAEAEGEAAPHLEHVAAAESALRRAEHDATEARLRQRLEGISLQPPMRDGHGAEIKPPGHGLSL